MPQTQGAPISGTAGSDVRLWRATDSDPTPRAADLLRVVAQPPILRLVPVSFSDTSLVLVRHPSGRWFWVRIVRADGAPDGYFTLNLLGILWIVARVTYCRVRWILRGASSWAVLVMPGPSNDDPPARPVRPEVLIREEASGRDAAVERAEELRQQIAIGALPTIV